jgi:ABC-2 type transport system ATP-binding protein
MPHMIQFDNITKHFGTITALQSVNLCISQGESVAVVGANGAGKTTLFNIALGLVSPDEGRCTILGSRSNAFTPAMREQVTFVADHASPVPWASSEDIAKLYTHLYTKWNQKTFHQLTSSWNIDISRKLNALSKGQKRLAEIALVVACRPEIIILDEPFNGLDPVMRIQIQRLLRSMQQEQNTTILHATHILTEIRTLADRMVIVRAGEISSDIILKDTAADPTHLFTEFYSNEINAGVGGNTV